jgi:hypothetical protein
MSTTLDLTSSSFVMCEKITFRNSDCSESGSKKCRRDYGGAYSCDVRSLRMSVAFIHLPNTCHLIHDDNSHQATGNIGYLSVIFECSVFTLL